MKTFEMLKLRQRVAEVESIGGNGRKAQEAAWELAALTEVFEWFDLLVQNLGSPTRFVDMMVMNMVTSPYTQYGTGEDYSDEPGLEWMLINRALFNRMVWELMREHGLIQKVRRVLRPSTYWVL